jgi:hypothetical protein
MLVVVLQVRWFGGSICRVMGRARLSGRQDCR